MHSPEFAPCGGELPRVLIAEDDSVCRLILKHWVRRWGYEVVVVDNGDDAWLALQQERAPEVVIMDWGLPGVDGIELCRRLRDKSRSYYHYILMVTSRTDELDVVHALESGADDCIGHAGDVVPGDDVAAQLRDRTRMGGVVETTGRRVQHDAGGLPALCWEVRLEHVDGALGLDARDTEAVVEVSACSALEHDDRHGGDEPEGDHSEGVAGAAASEAEK